MICRIERHAPEQNQVVPARLEFDGECFGDRERIGGDRIAFELHSPIGAHGKRLAERFLDVVGPEGDHDDFA
ncbi:hypothetical protein D3C83_29280 [compost metagenome]